jgi:hypothetical protein
VYTFSVYYSVVFFIVPSLMDETVHSQEKGGEN